MDLGWHQINGSGLIRIGTHPNPIQVGTRYPIVHSPTKIRREYSSHWITTCVWLNLMRLWVYSIITIFDVLSHREGLRGQLLSPCKNKVNPIKTQCPAPPDVLQSHECQGQLQPDVKTHALLHDIVGIHKTTLKTAAVVDWKKVAAHSKTSFGASPS